MKFRRYEEQDRDACLAAFDSNVPLFFSVHEREMFVSFLDRLPGRYAVVCDDSGAVVGCGGLAPTPTNEDPSIANFTWGMVHAAEHGKGYGRALVEGRLAWLSEMPEIGRVRMDTSHKTEKFYEKMGFHTLRRIPGFYREGLDRCDMEMVVQHGEVRASAH
jgi:GNAT superfamily N-acetyltransferase